MDTMALADYPRSKHTLNESHLAQNIQNSQYTFALDSGAANAYVIATTPASVAYVIGQQYVFKVANTNTGASTLNANGLGTTSLVKNGATALAAGDIAAGQIVTVVYDGTNFQIQTAGTVATNPMTTLGDTIYGAASGVQTRLAGNTTTTRQFMREVGDGTNAAAPAWDTLVAGDVPKTLDHTWTTDFDAQVNTHKVTDLTAPTSNFSMNSNKITNVTDPGSAQDAATKHYVDSNTAGANPMTTLGDTIYGAASGVQTRLAGNTTTTRQFMREVGNGTNAAAPAWDTLVAGDVPKTLDHTWTTDFDTQVNTHKLTDLTAPTSNFSMNSNKITNLTDPGSAQDAATKHYVDSNTAGANPMTTLGDMTYGGSSGTPTRLAGDTSNTRKFLREQSSGGVAAAPAWDTLVSGDVPKTLDHTWVTDFDTEVRTSRLDQMAAPTSVVSWNNQRLSSLANPTAAQDAVNAQTVQNGSVSYAADSGSVNAYAISLTPAVTSYTAGQTFVFKAANTNTGSSTLNVNSLGAKTVLKGGGSVLGASDISNGQIVEVVYDGSNFQTIGDVGSSVTATKILFAQSFI